MDWRNLRVDFDKNLNQQMWYAMKHFILNVLPQPEVNTISRAPIAAARSTSNAVCTN